eukprot:COSAG03_NODE_3923_length_1758_cov_7.858951_2_plen_162_part_00
MLWNWYTGPPWGERDRARETDRESAREKERQSDRSRCTYGLAGDRHTARARKRERKRRRERQGGREGDRDREKAKGEEQKDAGTVWLRTRARRRRLFDFSRWHLRMSRGKALLVADIAEISEHITPKRCAPRISPVTLAHSLTLTHTHTHTAYTRARALSL